MKKALIPTAAAATEAYRKEGLSVVQQILKEGERHSPRWIADTLYTNAEAARKEGLAAGAAPIFEAAIEWFIQLNEPDKASACQCNLGLCLKNIGQYEAAIAQLEQAYAIDLSTGNRGAQSSVLTNIGLCYDSLSQYDKAIQYYERSLAIDGELGDQSGAAYTKNNISLTLSTKGDYEGSMAMLESAIADYKRLNLIENLPNPLINLGNVLNRMGAHQEALAKFHEILNMVHGKPLHTAKCYNGIGSALMGFGDLRNAIAYYHAALDIYRQMGLEEGVSRSLALLADTHYALGSLDDAIAFLTEKKQLDEHCGNLHGTTIAAHGIGRIMSKQGIFDTAIQFYEEAYQLNQLVGDRDLAQTICINLANVYLYMEPRKTNAARLLFQKARRINQTVKSDTAAMFYHIGMSNLNLSEEKHRSSRYHARAAYAIAERAGAERTKIWALNNLSIGWLHPRTLHKAYRYGKKGVTLAEKYLSNLFDEHFLLSQRAEFTELYIYMAVLSYERKKYRESFHIMEMAKARVLSRQMGMRVAVPTNVVTKQAQYLYERERTLTANIHILQARQQTEGFTAENMRDLNHNSDELKAILHQLNHLDPAYFAVRMGTPLDYHGVKGLLK